jgi:hypothetical protein
MILNTTLSLACLPAVLAESWLEILYPRYRIHDRFLHTFLEKLADLIQLLSPGLHDKLDFSNVSSPSGLRLCNPRHNRSVGAFVHYNIIPAVKHRLAAYCVGEER